MSRQSSPQPPCPEAKPVLEQLKPFQRRTTEHAFQRLFQAEDSTARFLVADEAGLGKTLVARGVIAKAIEHMWASVGRIDVVYICSNAEIARANLPKLQVGANRQSLALATRLTLLATQLAPQDGEPGLADGKLNFVSFTPSTSFHMGHAGGQWRERAVLFHLLKPLYPEQSNALANLLQGHIQNKKTWLKRLRRGMPIEPTIRQNFEAALCANAEVGTQLQELLYAFRRRHEYADDLLQRRNRLLGELRRLLAEQCVKALEPDLVILDEFQRFKPLLETRPELQIEAAELAQRLFCAETPEGQPVRTLLLSATPYKLYTTDAEVQEENHYEDFLATSRFLLGDDEERIAALNAQLKAFRDAFKGIADGRAFDAAVDAKRTVETTLRAIMARTERTVADPDGNAMLREHPYAALPEAADIRQYLAAETLFRAVGSCDPMPYWKSASHLPHFMRGYQFNDRLKETLEQSPAKVVDALRQHKTVWLQAKQLERWKPIEPGNPKLRLLTDTLLGQDLWKLLWMPPTLPYWPLEGPFRNAGHATKTLLFSAWNVAPDAISALLSYEAERRMSAGGKVERYPAPSDQQAPLLQLSYAANDEPSRHRLLGLLLPCLPLADAAHPLAAPADTDRRAWVRGRVAELLAHADLPSPDSGPVDKRWDWAAPMLLDPGLRKFLENHRHDPELGWPDPKYFNPHIEDMLRIQPEDLGRRPDDLVQKLTNLALGSPAILALRSTAAPDMTPDARRWCATYVAIAFWHLFNRPAVISLLRQLERRSRRKSKTPYWTRVLRYCQQGNLQAVLDEQWHLLQEQHAWSEQSADDVAYECAWHLARTVEPVPLRVHAHFLKIKGSHSATPHELRIRTAFAQRFGNLRTATVDMEDSHHGWLSQDSLRDAFNSPFRPFVLASTSIGQEGLDFHPWCRRLVHWDLPGNPVDLEQREGRIHRYKSHAVRCNVAEAEGAAVLADWQSGDDLWGRIFRRADAAARQRGASDLVPHWIAEGSRRIERHVPLIPYTREAAFLKELKKQLVAYRIVLGQPRQEELVRLLSGTELDMEKLKELVIDLAPPPSMSQCHT